MKTARLTFTAIANHCSFSLFNQPIFQLCQVPQKFPKESLGTAGAGFFTGQIRFLSPNQQCQITEGPSPK